MFWNGPQYHCSVPSVRPAALSMGSVTVAHIPSAMNISTVLTLSPWLLGRDYGHENAEYCEFFSLTVLNRVSFSWYWWRDRGWNFHYQRVKGLYKSLFECMPPGLRVRTRPTQMLTNSTPPQTHTQTHTHTHTKTYITI